MMAGTLLGQNDEFKGKPEVKVELVGPLFICYCELSGEFHIGTKFEFCEICQGQHEFNRENVQLALKFLHEERVKLTEQINELRGEKKG